MTSVFSFVILCIPVLSRTNPNIVKALQRGASTLGLKKRITSEEQGYASHDSSLFRFFAAERKLFEGRNRAALEEFTSLLLALDGCPIAALGVVGSLVNAKEIDDAWLIYRTYINSESARKKIKEAFDELACERSDGWEVFPVDYKEMIEEYALNQAGISLVTLAYSLDDLERWNDAENVWETTEACMGPSRVSRVGIACCFRGRGELREAIGIFQSIVDDGSDDSCVRINLGHCYLDIGLPLDALGEYRRAYDLDPELKECRLYMAKAHTMLGNYSDALSCLEGVFFDDSPGVIPEYRGRIYHAQGSYLLAERELLKSLSYEENQGNEGILKTLEDCRRHIALDNE